jgi:hypothetical protein
VVNAKDCPFIKQEYSRVQAAIRTAASLIEKAAARTATKALLVLDEEVETIRKAVTDNRKKNQDDFTFSYEEETDPEIFFVPYVWEVIVCTVTASSIEWQKKNIRVFPLLEIEEGAESSSLLDSPVDPALMPQQGFAQDVSDVV